MSAKIRTKNIRKGTLWHYDPFVGVNGQGVFYCQTPCWSVLRMLWKVFPVLEMLAKF